MNKFVKNLVAFSLKNRIFIFFMTLLAIAGGTLSYLDTPIEAFPDVTNTQIIIISQYVGRSAEEVEKYVTIPIETGMAGVMKKNYVRSTSMFGLSIVTIGFDDGIEDGFGRQQVANRLMNVQLPDGVTPGMEPPYGPTGEIFRYTLESKTRSLRDLKTLQDWVVEREIRKVDGIADVVGYGGEAKSYEVSVNPTLLNKYNLTPSDVFNTISTSNVNVGGDVIQKGRQAYVVRGIGLLTKISDIEKITLKNINGTPIFVKNVATVAETHLPRLGQVGRDSASDVVEGIVVMRKGENPTDVMDALQKKLDEISATVLPSDVVLKPFYDRRFLIEHTTHTVIHNLLEGIILVTFIVLIFMADWRTTIVVAIVIPLSLLFAFICLKLKGMSANLLSMGAIDFGIIIDAAVVLTEGVFVALDHKAKQVGMEKFNHMLKYGLIKNTATELAKPIFFSQIIILLALTPIFSFQKVEGKLFSPLAWTLGFAILGALIFAMTLVPALISLLLNKNVREKHNPFLAAIEKGYAKLFDHVWKHKMRAALTVGVFAILAFSSAKFLGSEFLPELNEGSLWITATLPMSSSLEESAEFADQMRAILKRFPQVKDVLTQSGRPDDGTDPAGFFLVQTAVSLYSQDEWQPKMTREALIGSIDAQMSKFPGIVFNYSQPILDNVEEAVSGVKGQLAVKIYGTDLEQMTGYANKVYDILKKTEGVEDLGIIKNLGQPEFRIELDEDKMALYGVSKDDCQRLIEMAVGGKVATQFYEGEKHFDIRVRYKPQFRSSEEMISNLLVPARDGSKVPLKEIVSIRTLTGPAYVYRENGSRYIAVKFSVRGRAMGDAVFEAQAKTDKALNLPKGYRVTWNGEFENQIRASKRLSQVVPICLIGIFIVLFAGFGNLLDATLVLLNVPFAITGGILGLVLTGTHFSISAGIGFIALFGVCIQNGVILISVFKNNLRHRQPLSVAIRNGVMQRLRPVLMTALIAMLGLLPAAVSTGIGSETQKPLARVVIGGLTTSTLLTLLILPIIFYVAYRWKLRREGRIMAIKSRLDDTPN